MHARRFWPLTLRGSGALVLAAVAFIVAAEFGIGELVYVGVLLVAAVALGWLSLWAVHRYGEVGRSFAPDVVAVGGDCVVTVRSTTRGGIPGGVARWRDTLPRGIEGIEGGGEGAVRAAAAFDDMRVEYRVRATRRGIREIGPFALVVTDPFGLTRRHVSLGGTDSLTVTASIVALPPLVEFPGEAGGSLHTATHQLGEGADNLIPRAYSPGDSMRRINWRASAHHDTLMVRQEEQESTPEATVVLDRASARWAGDAGGEPGTDDDFESALSAALSAVARLSREGYDVVLIDPDGTALGAPVPAGDVSALEQLAVETATLVVHDDDHLAALPRLFSGTVAGPVAVVTGLIGTREVDAISGMVAHTSLPMLFAVAPVGGALAHAESRGWRAASIAPDDDLAEAWRTATDRGTSRVAS